MMRTIRVTGKGKLWVHPDMTRIVMTLEGKNFDYAQTLKESSESTEAMKDLAVRLGFERQDLKTLSFSVDPQYVSCKEKHEFRQRFDGYRYTHRMKLEFASDNQRLGKILYELANSAPEPQLGLSYFVRDPEAVKNELLGKAVQDAVAKAGVLSGAAGLSLGEIQSMDYSWGEIDFEVRPMNKMLACADLMCEPACGSYDMDIEPDDIDAEDTVTVVWEVR